MSSHLGSRRCPGARRRNLTIDCLVSLGMYRRALKHGHTHREARRWVVATWRDLPVFRAERGVDA